MLINFNIKKLDGLLSDFYRLTGLTISIWDAEFNQLSFQPKEMQDFCRTVKSTKTGKERCLRCDMALCKECLATGLPATHTCHAGLIDTAIPIKFKDTVLGYIMFGQTADKTRNFSSFLKSLAKDLGLDIALLGSLYNQLEEYDAEKIQSAAGILKMCTRYLWLSEYIEIGYNSDASMVDSYLRKNLASELSVASICRALNIPKNRLYEITHSTFGKTVQEYVVYLRIEESKKLLSSTDTEISRIAQDVGIKDYNYFIKLFRKQVGTTPFKYRKNFPFNIYN